MKDYSVKHYPETDETVVWMTPKVRKLFKIETTGKAKATTVISIDPEISDFIPETIEEIHGLYKLSGILHPLSAWQQQAAEQQVREVLKSIMRIAAKGEVKENEV